MVTIFTKIERFFTSNTLWIYLALFLVYSFLFMVSIIEDSVNNYLITFVKLCLIYLPILIFVTFRKYIVGQFSNTVQFILWGICFVLWLALLSIYRLELITFIFDIGQYRHPSEINSSELAKGVVYTLTLSVFVTELAILFGDFFIKKIRQHQWWQEWNIDKMILVLGVFLATLTGLAGAMESTKQATSTLWFGLTFIIQFVFLGVQAFLIFLAYYFFFYWNKEVLIPKLLKPKGVIYYGFAVAASIVVIYPVFIFLIRCLSIVYVLDIVAFTPTENTFARDQGGIPFLIMILSLPVIVSNEWFSQNSQIADLEKEKSLTELNLLKQQINPHFFFNTLNNLYALSITKDQQTPEVILQLSELMRYVIYKGKENLVSLEEEVKYIEDYIQLQQIRLHKKLDFHFEKEILDPTLQIPPLLFITFVENAFKHGIEPAEGACFLHLNLKSTKNYLIFICENSVEEQVTIEPGIGLENLKRRMELRFPKQHQLHIEQKEQAYFARLKIEQ